MFFLLPGVRRYRFLHLSFQILCFHTCPPLRMSLDRRDFSPSPPGKPPLCPARILLPQLFLKFLISAAFFLRVPFQHHPSPRPEIQQSHLMSPGTLSLSSVASRSFFSQETFYCDGHVLCTPVLPNVGTTRHLRY